MNKPDMEDMKKTLNRTGLIHIAFSVGSKEKVDELTMKRKKQDIRSSVVHAQQAMAIMKAVLLQ